MTPALRWSWSLRWMYPPTGGEKVFVIMGEYGFRACFDESGIDGKHGWLVVAGFVGTVKQWARFEKAWAPCAKQTPFHAKHFFARNPQGDRVGPYTGWSDEQASSYLDSLLRALARAKITPVGSAVDLDAFWEFSADERRRLTGGARGKGMGKGRFRLSPTPGKPYYLPFVEVLFLAIEAHSTSDLGVYFSFDENQVLQPHAYQVYRYVKERAKKLNPEFAARMKGITFQSDTDNIALQAADLLAYIVHQSLTRRRGVKKELRKVLSMPLQSNRGRLRVWSRQSMKRMVSRQ